MDTPISSAQQRRLESFSGTVRKSPPGSLGGSPRGMMIHPPSSFTTVPQASRTPGLAPSLSLPESRSPGGYNSASYSYSTSPSTASGGIPDNAANEQSGIVITPTHITSANLNTQKRAYRQRRKDPSCDACRERKVKCDATETTACSECSSRNHKCQFTKDTNRRMSSIKQVQDLQSQIAELQQEKQHLLTRVGGQDSMEVDPPSSRPQREHRPSFSTGRQPSAPVLGNFDHVRRNIYTHSAGIFQPPRPFYSAIPTESAGGLPNIPARTDFVHISRSYADTIHEAFPMLHWPTFQSEAAQVYAARSFAGMSREWIGMYFAVLACGCLNMPQSQSYNGGLDFYEIASQATVPWPQDPTIVHVRLFFLLSLHATESNIKSAGLMWLACATRAAQSLSLNRDNTAQPAVEVELQRRLWWAIYVQDRLASLGANLPLTINEDDCDIPLPSPAADDHQVGSRNAPHPHAILEPFVAVVRITRLFAGIHRTLKSNSVSKHELQAHEEQFRSVIAQYPESFRAESDARLNASSLLPVLTLHFARFQLYRRNLSPICSPADRGAALANCVSVAHDTAKAVQRTLQSADPKENHIRRIASNMVCIHLWRCILITCLQKEYQAALVCVGMLSAIGDARKINMACGKHIIFFLEQHSERVRRGDGLEQFADDEEMLAYASGDLQSSLEHSWAWAGAGATTTSTSHVTTQPSVHTHRTNESIQGTMPFRPITSPPDTGVKEWPGWRAVEYMINMLMGPQKRVASGPAPGAAPTYYPPPHNPVKRVQLAPVMPPVQSPKPSTPSNASRISIANII